MKPKRARSAKGIRRVCDYENKSHIPLNLKPVQVRTSTSFDDCLVVFKNRLQQQGGFLFFSSRLTVLYSGILHSTPKSDLAFWAAHRLYL